jgi:hypothetical protein
MDSRASAIPEALRLTKNIFIGKKAPTHVAVMALMPAPKATGGNGISVMWRPGRTVVRLFMKVGS